MKESYFTRMQNYVKAIVSQSSAGGAEARFSERFYAKSPISDLEKMSASDAAAIAHSAYAFMQTRLPGEPKIRMFTPTKETHGWDGRRFVIELLNDDMPFLVDSLSAELLRQGFTLYETIHPMLRVARDSKGQLKNVLSEEEAKEGDIRESFIHFETTAIPDDMTEEQLQSRLLDVLKRVRLAVVDWKEIKAKIGDIAGSLHAAKSSLPNETVAEANEFLTWLSDRNFVLLGYAEIDSRHEPVVVENARLGICKADEIPSDVPTSDALIEIRKSDRKSLVHRNALLDVVTIKRIQNGAITGEHRIYGLFASSVYYQSAEDIPLLRRKIARVFERTGYDPASHDGKALKTIIEFLPRDELFQLSEEELFEMGMGILGMEAKPGVRLFVRRDVPGRFASCMLFIPREYFSTQLRQDIARRLEQAFGGTMENFYTQITDAPLARVQLIIKINPDAPKEVDIARVENDIAAMALQWSDKLKTAMLVRYPEQKTERLFRTYSNAFPPAYIGRYDIGSTVYDIEKIEAALEKTGLAVELYSIKQEAPHILHLKIYNPNEEIALSDILPMLEHMGFRVIEEHPFLITPQGGANVWIRDFKLTLPAETAKTIEPLKPLIEEALIRVWNREVENDRFNALTLSAGLHYREAEMLRAYAKYLKQIGFTYSQSAIENALLAQPAIAKLLVAYFLARFAPDAKMKERIVAPTPEQFEEAFANVTSLADDRILRTLLELMQATLRTNFFKAECGTTPPPILSFKFNSSAVPDLPLPRPFAEIFVYSVRMEGIHLRGGKVARGGIRWSDRAEDFRTEILGLMKAQMVKNSVIVPVGSKGGFILKQQPSERAAFQAEGVACYTLFLQGLLDITDNIVGGNIIPPARVVRHDGDDPYLVVAADKGTATFSDTANAVSQAYNFWLDDAFASGGSAGYDHKEMGITARGGWVSVVRHFREMGVDITKEEFTCVGIGDMAGDVFGNGMLLSDNIKLIAAFNHLHIFIDPTPDAKKSFAERTRLFELPRSSWKEYDASLISPGGGIYERSAKKITLSAEAVTALGLEKDTFSPDELIKAILLAPVDLLWNGGIGTYVKAEDETHDQVGDRTNNGVRVNGRELRCKVVGEGGNLGFTQKGRIEYARFGASSAGGRINTDAIDNSGGVDCSDHEVNIKIAFRHALDSNRLTREARNHVLEGMTDEVARLVLKDNQLQTQAITIAQLQGVNLLESHGRLIQTLERQGLLNRAIEFLPSEKEIGELKLAHRGLTRPSLAVLLAYSKMALFNELVASSLPDEPYFTADLLRYFPKPMQTDFAAEINAHPLKREIIATVVTNSLVNRAGITFFSTIVEDSGLSAREVACAYTVARDAFGLRSMWTEIEKVGTEVPVSAQVEMYAATSALLERVTQWILRNYPHPIALEPIMQELAPGVERFLASMESMHSDATRKAYSKVFDSLREQQVPEALAHRMASLDMLASACDVILVARQTDLAIDAVGHTYFALGAKLKLGWLRHYAGTLPSRSHWERLATQALINDLFDEQRRLTAGACTSSVDDWSLAHTEELARFVRFLDDLKTAQTLELPALLVALRHVKALGA